MPYYFVTWSLKKGLVVKADSGEEAIAAVKERDVALEGVYIDNSFELEGAKVIDDELIDVVKNQGEGLP